MAKSQVAQLMQEDSVVGKVKSWPQRARGFLTDVRMEMKKVSTPSTKEVRATTTVVLIAVFIFAAYFYLIDFVMGRSVDQLFRYFK
ncbi:MAG: preprotein translocase subunit SecE [Acidobacteria bacterium]|nr:preprotein translocase subunit SecE [Acidobacteriota bacterium]